MSYINNKAIKPIKTSIANIPNINTDTSIFNNYNNIIEDQTDWSGTYLVAIDWPDSDHNDKYWVWDGTLNDTNNYKVDYRDKINKPDEACEILINKMSSGSGYSIQIIGGENDGKYISGEEGEDALILNETPVSNEIEYVITSNDRGVNIISNTSGFVYNDDEDQFIYMESESWPSYYFVKLFKKTGSTPSADKVWCNDMFII